MTKRKASGIAWSNEKRKLSDLIPWERNPRMIRDAQAKRLAESVETFGQVETLAIGPSGEIYNGHQRLSVLAGQYGMDYEVDVRVASRELTETERQKLTVFLHKGATGEFDFGALANWGIEDQLLEWGFSEEELGFAGLDESPESADAEPQIDKAEELRVKWDVRPGQLWRLPSRDGKGEHRLICGDCTDRSVVDRVMGGERAQIIYTSPPYWVGFKYENEKSWHDVLRFIENASEEYVRDVAPDGRIIINTGTVQAGKLTGGSAHMRLLIDTWASALEKNGWLMRYIRFWVKDGGLLHTAPQSDCIDQHTEFLGYFYNPKAKFRGQERTNKPWSGKGYWDDIPGAARQSGHIAAFPVELPSRDIQLFTRSREIAFDPFLGSGTTLIACENLSRYCRAIEISPAYVAVALQRYADAFGVQPELID